MDRCNSSLAPHPGHRSVQPCPRRCHGSGPL